MGLNNFGIYRQLRCSHTLKDEFLSSADSAPSSLLVALSKDVSCEAFSTHCTSVQMTMAHYSCLLSCSRKEGSRAYTQMWQRGFQKGERRFGVDWPLPSFLWQ